MKHDKIEDDIIYELASQKDLFNNNTGEISIEKFMVLRILRILPELENKILHGRIKDKETEKIRLEYYKQNMWISAIALIILQKMHVTEYR